MSCRCAVLVSLVASPLASALQRTPVRQGMCSMRMAETPDELKTARLSTLEECILDLDPETDDPGAFSELMDQYVRLKREGLDPGSSAWARVVAEAEQRSEAFRWASHQRARQRGDAFVRDRDRAEREAAAGLAPGSSEWAAAVGKASAESARAYREMEMQMKAAREAASCKRAALLEALFAGSSAAGSSEQAGAQLSTSLSTDAALDVLFNTGYDVEGGSGSLTQDGVRRMRAVIASTSAALKRGSKDSKDSKEVSLLLRRAALLVALGEPYLARADFERVLDLEPTNPEARKYVEIATYGAGFDPYEILGVARNADSEVISLAFRRLARQWHPDRWVSASEAQQIEAETRFKQLNLAQGVFIDRSSSSRSRSSIKYKVFIDRSSSSSNSSSTTTTSTTTLVELLP